MTTKKLKEIAEIISGYNFRSSIQEEENSSLFVLQSKNITSETYINENNIIKIENKAFKTAAFIQNEDIIISSRGSFRSAVVKSDKTIIVSSSLYIIRITSDLVLPEYVSLCLNSRKAQSQLLQSSTGAVINNLKIQSLKNIKLTIPDLEFQKKIVDLHTTGSLFSKLLIKKSNLVKDLAVEMINTL